MSFEQLFASSVLNVFVPDTSVEYPPHGTADEWLQGLQDSSTERRQAFFDEQLHFLLTVRIEHPSPDLSADPEHPPQVLLAFLAHTQISLEATYISTVPTPNPDLRTSKLSAPPRAAPVSKSGPRLHLHAHHPSILPPNTPNPTPSSAEHDRRYATSEGILLLASIFGQESVQGSKEGFYLLWSEKESLWVAVYRMFLTVSFLQLKFSDPLLCLTSSATLREKPLPVTQANHPLAIFFASVGSQLLAPPESPTSPQSAPIEEEEVYDRLEEVNLLEGLHSAPMSISDGQPLHLPSTRLGTVSRQKLFSLPPVSLPNIITPTPSPMTAIRTAHPTLRKSFRKILQTVSGFRVRMRTVFVPYIVLPDQDKYEEFDETQEERERREAGNEERTVVLCVEIENSGESGFDVGFIIEKVNVSVGGEGAKATLISRGNVRDVEKKIFPLFIGATAQYNLLYAVSFPHAPEEIDGFSLSRNSNALDQHSNAPNDLQRAITINIFGKPYMPSKRHAENELFSYPTATFSSRWNCVLDLSAQTQISDLQNGDDPVTGRQALPEPPSPFPASATPRTSSFVSPNGGIYSINSTPQFSPVAGSKRHTLPNDTVLHSIKPVGPRTNSLLNPSVTSPREREQPPLPGSQSRSYTPPSVSAQPPRSPTTYSVPPLPPLSILGEANDSRTPPPVTPAYPAYSPSAAVPPTPFSQGPIASQSYGTVGPSVEIRRERGTAMNGALVPQTPGPWVSGGFDEQKLQANFQTAERAGESIVVSVGLLPMADKSRRRSTKAAAGLGNIYPFDYFTLDIFVFNQSEWTRRFEITCPMKKRRRREIEDGTKDLAKKNGYPGILPLDARVRIGPLRPSACQSVRMEFLAVTPGVHHIDDLTLTDIGSGFSMNLRSIMDVVVRDPSD